MKYRFEDMTAADLALLGEGLDLLPHGKVQSLVNRMQAQISVQEITERKRIEAEQKAQLEAWRDGERAKLRAEQPVKKPRPRKKRRG